MSQIMEFLGVGSLCSYSGAIDSKPMDVTQSMDDGRSSTKGEYSDSSRSTSRWYNGLGRSLCHSRPDKITLNNGQEDVAQQVSQVRPLTARTTKRERKGKYIICFYPLDFPCYYYEEPLIRLRTVCYD